MTAAQFASLLNVVTLGAIMLAMGLEVKLAELIAAARNVPLMLQGVLANYLIVPLMTVGLLYAFQADPLVSAGFLILAVCPGSPAGPPLTSVSQGDVPAAVGLMVILGGSSALLSPLLLSWLLARLAPEGALDIDFLAIVRTLLVAQMLPLALGLAVGHYAPQFSQRVARPVGMIGNLLLLVLVALILGAQFSTLASIRARGWLGMGILLAASLAIGWICGGRQVAARKAMSLTTGVRNAAVGLVIATGNFAGTAAVTAVVAYGLGALFGGLAFALVVGAGKKKPATEKARG